YKKKSKKRKI
ncbi:Ditrans,polycis-undecaprenyl-diphosphate synthase ((2E,6E)-farnesyl-diphosphate specific), partial [Haemophilus influenzae]